MTKETKVDEPRRLLYALIFADMNLDQAGFAAVTRTAASQVSIYLHGQRTVPEAVLERALDARQFPRGLMQPALRAIRSFGYASRGWSRVDRAMSETFFAELLAVTGHALDLIFGTVAPSRPTMTEAPAAGDRVRAAALWLRLEARNARQQLALIEGIEDFQTWALCELVAAKSIEAAPSSPAKALGLAELSLRIADLCAGGDELRSRARGYAWFHVANALRVANDLPGSDAALTTATSLWEAGVVAGDSELFSEAMVLGLQATIRKSQRCFTEALCRVEDAIAADNGDLQGKLCLLKGQILGALGEIEASAQALGEAASHIDPEREPRTALGVHLQFLFNLCLQGRAEEAAVKLPAVQALAEQLGQDVDLVQVAFIAAKIATGTGQTKEAEEAFEHVRQRFASFEPPLVLDYAQVSLDLALLHLEQGRTLEAQRLAEEMTWIFSSQGVQQEALAGIRVFWEAARREGATVDLTRKVIRFLHRAQHDPALKFSHEADG